MFHQWTHFTVKYYLLDSDKNYSSRLEIYDFCVQKFMNFSIIGMNTNNFDVCSISGHILTSKCVPLDSGKN